MNREEAPSDDSRRLRMALMLRWPQLTDDDLLLLDGPKTAFLERLRQRVGADAEGLERQLDELRSSLELDRKNSGVIHLTAG